MIDFLSGSEHAHFLFNNDLDRWVPGTEDPIEVNDGHPPSNDNMIQPMILDAVSLLLKNYPMFRIKPSKPSDYGLSDEINKQHIVNVGKVFRMSLRIISPLPDKEFFDLLYNNFNNDKATSVPPNPENKNYICNLLFILISYF